MSNASGHGPDGTHTAPAFREPTAEGSRDDGSKTPPVEDQVGALEELTYGPVPPRRSVPIQVTCRLQGRGQPLAFPIAADAVVLR
jgi:hypothetical protein